MTPNDLLDPLPLILTTIVAVAVSLYLIQFCDHYAIDFAILDMSDLTMLSNFNTDSESFVVEFIGDNNGEKTMTYIMILNAMNTLTQQCGSGSLHPIVQLPIPLQLQQSNGNNNNTNNNMTTMNMTMSMPNLNNYLQVKLTTRSNVDDLNCSPLSQTYHSCMGP